MDVTDVIGNFGNVQKRVLLILLVRSLALCSVGFVAHLITMNVDHWCSPQLNVTAQEWKECCIPEGASGSHSQCHYYSPFENKTFGGNRTETECSSWYYDEKEAHVSLVSEWDLVCSRRWQLFMLFSINALGNFLAYGPSGYFADRFGRRASSLFGLLIIMCSTLACAFSTSVTMFAAFRFITGLAYPFAQHATLSLYMEMVGKKERTYTQYIYNGAWGLGTALQAGISLAVPNWRRFILIASCPLQLIFILLLIVCIPESPKWLIATKRYSKAEKVIKKIAAANGIHIVDTEHVMKSLKEKIECSEENEKSSKEINIFREFFMSRRLRVIAFILCFINCAKAFLGSGFSISLRHFGGIVQINYVVHGLVSVVSSIVLEVATAVIKLRRITLVCCYVIAGAMFLFIIFINDDYYWLKLSLAMAGNIMKKVASASLYLAVAEIFPTNMRGRGSALYMAAGRIGNLLAPLTDLLAYQYGKNSPLILFASICAMLSALVYFLPDTENFLLPDSVQESDKFVKASDRKTKTLVKHEESK